MTLVDQSNTSPFLVWASCALALGSIACVEGAGGSTRMDARSSDAAVDVLTDVPTTNLDAVLIDRSGEVDAVPTELPSAVDVLRPDVLSPSDIVSDVAMTVTHMPVAASARCDDLNRAPLRTGLGPEAFECVRLGALDASASGDWPVTTGALAPVVYVRGGAVGSPDGTMERPYPSIASALASRPTPATIAIARGELDLPSTVITDHSLTLVGVGSSGTTVRVSRGHAGIAAEGEETITLRGLALTYPSDTVATSTDEALRATARAHLDLQDVRVAGAAVGVRVRGATLTARQLTIRGASMASVALEGSAQAQLQDFMLRDGARLGIFVSASHLQARDGAVLGHAQQGISFVGDANATGGVVSCDDAARGGAVDCLWRVAVLDNAITGLAVFGRNVVEGRLLSLSRTRRAATPIGDGGVDDRNGDGALVTAGASLSLDVDVTTDARQGHGSEVADNARAGVLVQGDGASALLRGSRVAGNGASGVFVAMQAAVSEVGYSLIEGNALGGVIVVPQSSIATIQCNGIFDTRMGSVMTTTGMLIAGDGLSLNDVDTPTLARVNAVSRSERFGIVASEAMGQLIGNTGDGNQYGIGLYGRVTPIVDDIERVGGLRRPPTVSPGLVGTGGSTP